MATLQIRIQQQGGQNVQRQIQDLRGTVTQLNRSIVQNREALLSATGAERQHLQALNRSNSVQRAKIQQRIQELNLQKQNIALAERETQARNQSTRGTNLLTRSVGSLTGALGGLGVALLARELLQFGANSVQASVRVEGFRNSLTALYGDAQVANRVLADLQELAQLPGITFESAVQGAVRLKTVGVEGARAEGVIREFGNAAALAGASTDEVGRSLVGLTQILSRGKISQEELNQILENLPLIGNSIREAFGSIDAEVIRDQLDAAGQSVQDFADILVNQLSMGARASADSTRNAFSNLENATFRLHAAIGDRLSPAVREATGFLTDLANTAADFVSGTDDATRAATSYANALMAASNAAAVNSAIQSRIEFLRQEKAALDEAAEGSANYFRLRGRETGAGAQYREITEELGELTAALTHTAEAAVHFGNIQNQLLSQARDITQDITDLEVRRADETGRAYGKTTREINVQREALAETQKEIGENAVVLRALASANTVVTAATDESTAATKESTEATKEATVEILTYAEAIRQVQANIKAYVAEQALLDNFSEFWRIAASDAGDFENALAITVPTITNTEAELAALQGAFGANNDTINNAIGFLDGFTGDLDSLNLTLPQTTSEGKAVAQAFRDIAHQLNILERIQTPFKVHRDEINLINPAVSQAVSDFREYAEELDATQFSTEALGEVTSGSRARISAFANETLTAEGVIGNFARRVGETEEEVVVLASTSDRLTESIREQSGILNHVSIDLTDVSERYRGFKTRTDESSDAIDRFNEGLVDIPTHSSATARSIEELEEVLYSGNTGLFGSVEQVAAAFQRLGTTLSDPKFFGGFLDVLGSVNDELADVAGSVSNLISAAARGDGIAFLAGIPDLVHSLNELQNDPNLTTESRADRVFGAIRQIRDSDLSQGQQQELIAPLEAYIRELFVRSILSAPQAISPALIRQHESLASTQGVSFDFARDRSAFGLGETPFQTPFALPEIDLSGVIQELQEIERLGNSSKQRRGSGETTTQQAIGGTGAGRSTAAAPTLRALTDVQSAYIQSLGLDPSIYGYDARRNAFVKTAGGAGPTLIYDDSVAFEASQVPTTATGSALGTPTTQRPPSETFSFTGAERAILTPYAQALERAEDAVEDLTADSTVEEVAEAYENLVFAQTNLRTVSEGIINAAVRAGRITETAGVNAVKQLDIDLGGDIRSANTALIRSLSDIGYEVVGGIMNIREAVDVSDIPNVFRRIPDEIDDAAETPEPPPLQTRFRFTDEQGRVLDPLEDEINEAREAIRLLSDESTPAEITAAYTRLANAEQAFAAEQLEFIDAGVGVFTDTALESARDDVTDRVGRRAFAANMRLVGTLGRVGFQLVTMFDESSGFLQGIGLAIEQIPIPETPEASTELRDRHRFTQAQSGVLGSLEITANEAEETLRRLRRDDTATPAQITEAYEAFIAAEQAILDQELAFIGEATNITDAARTAAEDASRGRFRGEIFDANELLVGGLENLGYTLTTTITDWFSILMGAALDISQIPEPEVPDTPDAVDQPLSPAVFAQNRRNRTRFERRSATTEAGFDTARQAEIDATNDFYDLEHKRLGTLGYAEDVLADKRADNQLDREQALFRFDNLENPFREQRIADAESEADARLRAEERVQADIDDLRDDALDAEADHLERIADLQVDHNRRILDLETDLTRDLDDLRRERLEDARDDHLDYTRDLEDLQNRLARQQFDADSFGDLTAEQRRQLEQSDVFRRGSFDLNLESTRERQDRNIEFGGLRPGSAGYEFYRQQFESGQLTDQNLIRQLFGTQGLDDSIDQQRGTEDADLRLERAIVDATTVYDTRLLENTNALNSLTTQLAESGVIRIIEPSGGALGGDLMMLTEAVAEGVEMALPAGIEDLVDPTTPVIEMPAPPTEFNVETVSINAQNVSVSGGGGQTQPQPQQPAQQNVTVLVDFGDGAMTELEGKLVQRSDEGLSELDV